MANINELLKEHVVLDVECLDRIYLNGYIPRLASAWRLGEFFNQT